jgi:pimeloyl-ACP methyl ester carboxylesterase
MPLCEVARGVELYYEDFGEGPPIVFTSAGNLTHKIWMGQVAGLAPDIRTITYDIRGTGLSTKPRAGYSAPAAAADLCALTERLALGPATMVAHGIGTHIALMAAEKRPDLVSGLVLLSGGPWFHGERDGVTAGVADDFLAFLTGQCERGVPYPQICEEMIGTWLFRNPPTTGVVHALLEQALAWPQFVLNALSQSMRDVDHRHRLPSPRLPDLDRPRPTRPQAIVCRRGAHGEARPHRSIGHTRAQRPYGTARRARHFQSSLGRVCPCYRAEGDGAPIVNGPVLTCA